MIKMKEIVLKFILKHWKEILLVVLSAGIFIKGRMDYAALFDMHQESVQLYQTQIDELNLAHKEQLRRKDEAIEQYIQRVENIRNEYDAQKEEISNRRETEKEEIRQILQEKPEELINDIETRFNFSYVE